MAMVDLAGGGRGVPGGPRPSAPRSPVGCGRRARRARRPPRATALWEYLTITYVAMLFCWLWSRGGLAGEPHRRAAVAHATSCGSSRRSSLVAVIVSMGDAAAGGGHNQGRRGRRSSAASPTWTAGSPTRRVRGQQAPAYLFLSSGLVAAVAPSVLAFRAMMGLADALVAVMLLHNGARAHLPPRTPRHRARLRGEPDVGSLCGHRGHYDPSSRGALCADRRALAAHVRSRPLWGSMPSVRGVRAQALPAVLLRGRSPRSGGGEGARSWSRRFVPPMALHDGPHQLAQRTPGRAAHSTDLAGRLGPRRHRVRHKRCMDGWTDTSAAARTASTPVRLDLLGLLL